jgi:hypothetical protein
MFRVSMFHVSMIRVPMFRVAMFHVSMFRVSMFRVSMYHVTTANEAATNTPRCWLATWQRQQRPWPLLLAGTNTRQLTLTPGHNRPGSSCHRAPLEVSGQRQALGVVGELLGPFLVLLRGHNSRKLPAVRCVSAGAERRGARRALRGPCLCSKPTGIQEKTKNRTRKLSFVARWIHRVVGVSVDPPVVGRDWSPVSSNKARGCCCRTPGDHRAPLRPGRATRRCLRVRQCSASRLPRSGAGPKLIRWLRDLSIEC